MRCRTWMIALALLSWMGALPSQAADFDHSAWNRVLQRVVHPATVEGMEIQAVDYAALAQGDEDFQLYLKQLAEFDPSGLEGKEKLAFWMNAYNAVIFQVVVENWPLKSIMDVNPWDKATGKIGGVAYSPNQIENEIVRPMGDARIHTGLVCAAVSCPDLRREAFTAASLDEQLDEQARLWMAHSKKGLAVDPKSKTVQLSKIFEWFGDDFKKVYGDGLGFAKSFASKKTGRLLKGAQWKVEYFEYNWAINARPSAR